MRLSLSAESLNPLFILVAVHPNRQFYTFSDFSTLITLSSLVLNGLQTAEKNLIDGDDKSEPCKGFDSVLDDLNIIDNDLEDNLTVYTYYANASIHQMITIYTEFATSLMQYVSAAGTTIPVDLVANLIYLANYRMFDRLKQVTDRIVALGSREATTVKRDLAALLGSAIVIIVLFVFVVFLYYNNRVNTYRAAISVIKRFSPYLLLNNKKFDTLFLKSDSKVTNGNLTLEENIIKCANDTIFLTNVYGVIEVCNNSVNSLLGFTLEQVLGQNISCFISQDDGQKVSLKLEQMRNGQSSYFYEDDFNSVTDASKEIPVHVTIIGMKKDYDLNSFAVILRDQTDLVDQKLRAEEAKAKSEQLLYQILPRDVVVQLNKGEKNISFVVPSATIIFIDINRFSEYSSNLTPTDIMSNLSYYFAVIDKIASKYEMVQKIKLIGDIYMAATGLFHPEASPESHAEQTVLFALEVISALDEINLRLSANLQIRIGINTGGPIIAGVLGTDKPVFDIIGDPINVAARLQSTSDVNKVHISQATESILTNMNFEITKRGETFLKGKGKQMTYYIANPPPVVNPLASFVVK